MKKLFLSVYILLLFVGTETVFGQGQNWQADQFTKRNIPTSQHYDFTLIDESKTISEDVNLKTIAIPDPEGKSISFQLSEVQVMSEKLAAKYPMIKTYIGKGENGEEARFSTSPKGLHAMVFSKEGLYFIDPVDNQNNKKYQAYFKRNLSQSNIKTDFLEKAPIIHDQSTFDKITQQLQSGFSALPPTGPSLRTYRIAIAATGEYSSFHGGTIENTLAAIVTTMTRVNAIYERELAIRMVLVDNNDQLIFLNSNTDPFTNGSASAYIDEVQAYLDNNIGSANYDIGHGFSTGAGGLAGLGVVCIDGEKGSGVTGTSSPIGDPYDVDYVAHEIGHQFGAPHTFNGTLGSCSGNGSSQTSYEPGSGVTIMAYAGICGSDNIADNSIPYFHASSLQYISAYSQEASGNSCAIITNTGNSFPAVEAGQGGFTIPISTPFQLNGTATDADGDQLSYSWEQFDLGPRGAPNSPAGNAPLFRSFTPSNDNFRVFPQMSDLLNGTKTLGEILPDYSRDLNFILTVRDNQTISGVNSDQISFSVSDVGGPFTVDSIEGDYLGFDNLTVQWDVANTNQSPINCSQVNIYLSTDGGFTYDYLLVENTINDGFETVVLPNIASSKAKIKVAAAQNIFFNLSGSFFSIQEFQEPNYTISAIETSNISCLGDAINFQIESAAILNYSEPVNLSIEGLTNDFNSSFSSITINPGQNSVLNLSYTGTESIDINFKVIATSGSIIKELPLSVLINTIPNKPFIIGPIDNAQSTSLSESIYWTDNNKFTSYSIALSEDAQFNTIVASADSLMVKEFKPSTSLKPSTTYYIRLGSQNNCGKADLVFSSFTTATEICNSLQANDLPLPIPTTVSVISSSIEITDSGIIESLSLSNIAGTHSYISDLTFTLISPAGTRVKVFSEKCSSMDDFFFSFSDGADTSVTPCPPTDGGTYKPAEPFSSFIGEAINGIWTLEVSDAYGDDGGSLNQWALTYCSSNATAAPKAPTALNYTYKGNEIISLDWIDNSDNETGFYIQRAKNTYDFITVATLNANENIYEEQLPSIKDIYKYRVLAFNSGGPSFSNTVETSLTILEQVATPGDLSVSYKADSTIIVSWTDNADNESNYLIEADFAMNNEYSIIDTLNLDAETYELKLVNLDSLSIRVKAFNKYTESKYVFSSSFSLASVSYINPPTNLTVSYVDGDTIRLAWIDNSPNETSYIVERKISSSDTFDELFVLNADSSSVLTSLPSLKEEFTYRVYALNQILVSDFSNSVNASISVLANKIKPEGQISIYPNPADRILSIYNPQNDKIMRIDIISMQGGLITRVVNTEQTIAIGHLRNGIYIIRIQTENNQYNIRFIKK